MGVPGFKGKYKESDGNNVHISKYIDMFNYYDLESCCNRKINIVLKNQIGQIAKNKSVIIESEYSGKFKQTKFVVNTASDDLGNLPVIVRHPGSKIIIKADGKQSSIIVQEADRRQSVELSVTDEIKVQSVLEKPAQPQPRIQNVVIEQKQEGANVPIQNHSMKSIKFDISIIEGDTNKKITNMKFFLRYKGKIKQHLSDSSGVKYGVFAEEGETVDILVNGSKSYQKIKTLTVSKAIENTCVIVPLSTLNVKLKVHGSDGKILKNNKFYVRYRGREIEKKTDSNGILQLNMLNAFVYKLLLSNRKEVLILRNDPSIQLVNVNLNVVATNIQRPTLSRNLPKITNSKPEPEDQNFIDYLIDYIPSFGKSENVHTESNGNPLTKQYGSDVSFTVKTINKATGTAENLSYEIKYNGAKRSHYSGQDGVGLKKHRGEEGKKIEIIVSLNGKDQVLYSTILKNPMPVIELKIDKPKDNGLYLFPLKTRTNSYKKSYAQFGSNRDKGKRKHAGCDLYAPAGTEVRAMADGIVRNVYYFYSNTDAIEITHKNHIIRYGEVKIGKALVKKGDSVKKGDIIGYVGNLSIKGIPSMMLHLEMFSNTKDERTLSGSGLYKRRSDLVDPTPFLDKATM